MSVLVLNEFTVESGKVGKGFFFKLQIKINGVFEK